MNIIAAGRTFGARTKLALGALVLAGVPALSLIPVGAAHATGGDGTNKKIYLDGTLMTTYGYSQTLNNNGYAVSLGYNLEFGSSDYDGLLDDVRIYSRALDATEIANDMAAPVLN